MITSALQAIGLFLVTNIDDIIVLSLFFARGAGQPGTTTRIALGQHVGFGGILLASVVVTLGAGLFLPDDAVPYFGLIPLLLGARAAWQLCATATRPTAPSTGRSASSPWPPSPSANGGDNIGGYVPVFLTVGP